MKIGLSSMMNHLDLSNTTAVNFTTPASILSWEARLPSTALTASYVMKVVLAIINMPKSCHFWQLTCHFWQFPKLPILATLGIALLKMELPKLATYGVAKIGYFLKLESLKIAKIGII